MYGSSAALARPLIEATIRGTWLSTCGNEKIANDVFSGTHKFKDLRKLTQDIDAAQGGNVFESQYNLLFPAFHDFTHGAARQILRRFKDGKVEASFTINELIQLINIANSYLLIMLTNLVSYFNNHKINDEVISLQNIVIALKSK